MDTSRLLMPPNRTLHLSSRADQATFGRRVLQRHQAACGSVTKGIRLRNGTWPGPGVGYHKGVAVPRPPGRIKNQWGKKVSVQ